jgi:ubiquitin-conjugating enzyme E2 J2
MTSVCLGRLRKEYQEIRKKPLENIRTAPKETNLLEWHYVIEGPKGSPYEGGYYHGMVLFPKEYPHKPPSIHMFTPNGRFKPNTRLCLSISDFHPETWNPLWSVGTILLGLYTFMLDPSEQPTYGSITTSNATKQQFAAESLEYNVNNETFCELFPDLVEAYEERKPSTPPAPVATTTITVESGISLHASWTVTLGILAAVVAFTWALLSMSI